MPFDFLKRKKTTEADEAVRRSPRPGRGRARGIPFDGLTEEWRIVGNMEVGGRLSDVLNKRESIDDLRRPVGAGRRLSGDSRRRPGSRRSIPTT